MRTDLHVRELYTM